MPTSTAWTLAAFVVLALAYAIHATALHRELPRWKTDDLTGLAVRKDFLERAGQSLARPGTVVAYVDLDGFKAVNDSYDHSTGDAVLAEVGRRIRQHLVPGAIAGRIGGDEFAVVVPPDAPAHDVLDALRRAIAAPIAFHGAVLSVGASIGALQLESRPIGIETALGAAEREMYVAKRGGLGVNIAAATRPLRRQRPHPTTRPAHSKGAEIA